MKNSATANFYIWCKNKNNFFFWLKISDQSKLSIYSRIGVSKFQNLKQYLTLHFLKKIENFTEMILLLKAMIALFISYC